MGKFESKKVADQQSTQREIVLFFRDMVIVLSAVVLFMLLVLRGVVVDGDSMKDTLVDGDYLLLLSSTFYHNPEQGDIIVASKEDFAGGEPIIKRVIATEGQTVDIDFVRGVVIVDGVELDEPYTRTVTVGSNGVQFPFVVEEGCLFVLGDNRAVSKDSRFSDIGLIDCRQVLGKAVFLIFPGSEQGNVPADFSRIGAIS